MRRSVLATVTAVAALCLSGLVVAPAAAAPADPALSVRNTPVCPGAVPGTVRCFAVLHEVVDRLGKPVVPDATSGPAGFGPAQIRGAYNLGAASGAGRTVAIVDAYDNPNAEADLGVYRSKFSLTECTTLNGCFRKVNQAGGSQLPKANAGWGQEIALDLDMVSAACPDCKILLVEAQSSSFADLSAAVAWAATQSGVVAISNSYGGSDFADPVLTARYDQPGIAVTASTGDNGYGVSAPASFPSVVAVGGTSLRRDSSTARGWAESAWSGAGSGCSTLNDTTWQNKTLTGCAKKANADVSAVADPNTGVAVYDSYAYQGRKGWMVFGGTSASSPIVASVYAMGSSTKVAGGTTTYPGAYTWANSGALNDVVGGSNGTCSTAIWCNSGSGWDGPTGLGTPNGTSAF